MLPLVGFLSISGCGGGGGSSSSGTPPGNNSATLTWDAPVTNVDGSPLTDLAGYKIYYGTTSRIYSVWIDVGIPYCQQMPNGVTTCTYSVGGLSSGIYFFALTAYDTSSNESDYSNEVSKTIN